MKFLDLFAPNQRNKIKFTCYEGEGEYFVHLPGQINSKTAEVLGFNLAEHGKKYIRQMMTRKKLHIVEPCMQTLRQQFEAVARQANSYDAAEEILRRTME